MLEYTSQPVQPPLRTIGFSVECQHSQGQIQSPLPTILEVYEAPSHSLVQRTLSPMEQTEIGSTKVLFVATTSSVRITATNSEGNPVTFDARYQFLTDTSLTDIAITAQEETAIVTLIYTD